MIWKLSDIPLKCFKMMTLGCKFSTLHQILMRSRPLSPGYKQANCTPSELLVTTLTVKVSPVISSQYMLADCRDTLMLPSMYSQLRIQFRSSGNRLRKTVDAKSMTIKWSGMLMEQGLALGPKSTQQAHINEMIQPCVNLLAPYSLPMLILEICSNLG